MHERRERSRALLQRKMNVIRHQAVRVQAKSKALPVAGNSLEIVLAIRVIAKDFPPFIPADYQVMKRAGRLEPRRSCHTRKDCREVRVAGFLGD